MEAAPRYREVSMGAAGHVEAVRVTFDPRELTYDDLLNVFWEMHGGYNVQGNNTLQLHVILTPPLPHQIQHKRMAKATTRVPNIEGVPPFPLIAEKPPTLWGLCHSSPIPRVLRVLLLAVPSLPLPRRST